MLKIVFMFDIKGIKQVSRYHSNFQNINIYIYILSGHNSSFVRYVHIYIFFFNFFHFKIIGKKDNSYKHK